MQEIDPEGVEIRTPKRLIRRAYFAKGSNCIWHINSKGSTRIVRGDCGTKRDMHVIFRYFSSKQLITLKQLNMSGASTSNQTIESWWGF
ncbi:hypothetical protein KUTeg_023570 [Tegillarca granosa]|uniref:CUB domain-containing protein n=1 Tax=Tegillarca granosa TaxID=220873 RepID=A0ABQ9E301_TEGGR|nr:hypothetical protein KUTeg_023570 [Tegillarca granosa]